LQDDAEQIVRAVVEKAKRGDMTAARLNIERIGPVRKGRPITLDLPDAKTGADLAAAMASLVRAMAIGEVTPDEAATVAGVFEVRRKTIESVEFEERLQRWSGGSRTDGFVVAFHLGASSESPCHFCAL
jgi:hypothetical protein